MMGTEVQNVKPYEPPLYDGWTQDCHYGECSNDTGILLRSSRVAPTLNKKEGEVIYRWY